MYYDFTEGCVFIFCEKRLTQVYLNQKSTLSDTGMYIHFHTGVCLSVRSEVYNTQIGQKLHVFDKGVSNLFIFTQGCVFACVNLLKWRKYTSLCVNESTPVQLYLS